MKMLWANILLMLMGLGVLFFYAIHPIYIYTISKNWIDYPAIVQSATLVTTSDSENLATLYGANIRFKYIYKGKEYTGTSYDTFLRIRYFNKVSIVKNILERYPVGSPIMCLLNPDNPNQAILCREFPNEWGATTIGCVFFLLGFTVFLHFL